jgi:putative acetyltransferase
MRSPFCVLDKARWHSLALTFGKSRPLIKAMRPSEIKIRHEVDGDYDDIYALTQQAFAPMAYSDGDEQGLINALRDAGALALSLVATNGARIVGHIAFSNATAADGTPHWFALGPVSVAPDLQGQGIGGALIREGIAQLTAIGASGCILVGNPNYYERFGFKLCPDLAPIGQPKAYFMILALGNAAPSCVVSFHPLFGGSH